MAITFSTPTSNVGITDSGNRLADAQDIANAILNANSKTQAYGISVTGSTQATAVQLTSVYNQIDTSVAGGGVALPPSTGRINSPYQFCVIYNNTSSSIQVYGSISGTDTINGILGSTGLPQPGNTTYAYVSAKKGAWSVLAGGVGESYGQVATGTFSQASSTVLTAVPGLTNYVATGGTYLFDIYLSTTNNSTGGIKLALGGTATATQLLVDTWVYNSTTLTAESNITSLSSNLVAAAVAATSVTSSGSIIVNAGGTLILQAAQDVSNATALTIANGSYFTVNRIA